MTENDLAKLVQTIVETVLERIKNDPELNPYFNPAPSQTSVQEKPAEINDTSVHSTNQHLITEHDMRLWHSKGITTLYVGEKSIFTPSAMDVARDKKITVMNKAQQ